MANIKISQLPTKGANLGANDLVEISEFTGTGYVSKSITGQEIIDAASGGGGVNPTSTYIPYNKAGVFQDSSLVVLEAPSFIEGPPVGFYSAGNPVFGGNPNLYIDDLSTLYSFGQANPSPYGTMSAYAGIAIRQGGFIMGCNFASPFDGVFRADVNYGYITIGTNDSKSIGVDTNNDAVRIGKDLATGGGPFTTIVKYIKVTDDLYNTYYLPLYQ